jgi:hypothetical protein
MLLSLAPVSVVSLIAILSSLRIDPNGESYRRLITLIERGFELDARGKELAYEMNNIFSGRDIRFLYELGELYEEIGRTALKAEEEAVESELKNLLRETRVKSDVISGAIRAIADKLRPTVNRALKNEVLSRYIDPTELRNIEILISELEERHEQLTGRSCLWFYKTINYDIEKYTFAGLINDVTACHHGIINILRILLDPALVKIYDKIYAKEPHPVLAEGLKKWSDVTKRLYELGLIFDDDYKFLRAIIINGVAEVRLGSELHHDLQVKISVSHDKLVAEFYNVPWFAGDTTKNLLKFVSASQVKEEYGTTFVRGRPVETIKSISAEMPISSADVFFKAVLPMIVIAWTAFFYDDETFIEYWKGVIPEPELRRIISLSEGDLVRATEIAIIETMLKLGLVERSYIIQKIKESA